MKTLQLATLLALTTLFTTSCFRDGGLICTKPSGETISEESTVDDFDRIELQMEGEVFISQGEEYKVEVEASENILDIIVVNVSGNELVLRTKRGKCIRGESDVKFYVTTPTVEGITLSGSGRMTNVTPLTGSEIDVTLSGSGEIELDELDYELGFMNISGSGTVDVDGLQLNDLEAKTSGSGNTTITRLTANVVDMRVTGSGDVTFEGEEAERLTATISGSGELHAFELPADDVEVDITGSGGCEVTANESLDIRITGSGSVRYKGRPSINQNITGSGSVINAN